MDTVVDDMVSTTPIHHCIHYLPPPPLFLLHPFQRFQQHHSTPPNVPFTRKRTRRSRLARAVTARLRHLRVARAGRGGRHVMLAKRKRARARVSPRGDGWRQVHCFGRARARASRAVENTPCYRATWRVKSTHVGRGGKKNICRFAAQPLRAATDVRNQERATAQHARARACAHAWTASIHTRANLFFAAAARSTFWAARGQAARNARAFVCDKATGQRAAHRSHDKRAQGSVADTPLKHVAAAAATRASPTWLYGAASAWRWEPLAEWEERARRRKSGGKKSARR